MQDFVIHFLTINRKLTLTSIALINRRLIFLQISNRAENQEILFIGSQD